jgi:hypothetical protein
MPYHIVWQIRLPQSSLGRLLANPDVLAVEKVNPPSDTLNVTLRVGVSTLTHPRWDPQDPATTQIVLRVRDSPNLSVTFHDGQSEDTLESTIAATHDADAFWLFQETGLQPPHPRDPPPDNNDGGLGYDLHPHIPRIEGPSRYERLERD